MITGKRIGPGKVLWLMTVVALVAAAVIGVVLPADPACATGVDLVSMAPAIGSMPSATGALCADPSGIPPDTLSAVTAVTAKETGWIDNIGYVPDPTTDVNAFFNTPTSPELGATAQLETATNTSITTNTTGNIADSATRDGLIVSNGSQLTRTVISSSIELNTSTSTIYSVDTSMVTAGSTTQRTHASIAAIASNTPSTATGTGDAYVNNTALADRTTWVSETEGVAFQASPVTSRDITGAGV